MTAPFGSPDRQGWLRTVVEIAAPPDAVFAALADERELAAWLSGDRSPSGERRLAFVAPTAATPGQPWHVPAIAPDGSRGRVEGELLLVDRPHRLETTWRASWDGFAPDRVCFELTPIRIGGAVGTRVTVTHTRAGTYRQVTAMGARVRAGDWSAILARLGAWLSQHTPIGVVA